MTSATTPPAGDPAAPRAVTHGAVAVGAGGDGDGAMIGFSRRGTLLINGAPRPGMLVGSAWFAPFNTPLGRTACLRDPRGNAFAVVHLSAPSAAVTGGNQ